MILQKTLLYLYVPDFVKKQKLQELFTLTAEAFQCEAPSLKGLSFQESMHKYALFTKEQAENQLRQPDDPLDANNLKCEHALKDRLYKNAFQYGQSLRKKLHCRTPEEIIAVCRLIYKILGIEFCGDTQGNIVISRCFFSAYYSAEVCRLISSLDEGLAAGLSAGSRLAFAVRMTEGNPCCKAFFDLKKE